MDPFFLLLLLEIENLWIVFNIKLVITSETMFAQLRPNSIFINFISFEVLQMKIQLKMQNYIEEGKDDQHINAQQKIKQ